MVETLLSLGVDATIVGHKGTARDVAMSFDLHDMVKILDSKLSLPYLWYSRDIYST